MTGTDLKKNQAEMAPKLLGWNSAYLFSSQGILNVSEIIICYTSIVLMSDACRAAYSSTSGGFVGTKYDTYFYVSSYACFIITLILLWCLIISRQSYSLAGRTIIIFAFWFVCFAASMGASMLLLVSTTYPHSPELQIAGFTNKIASSALGIFNALLYATSSLQAYRTCKNSSMNFLTYGVNTSYD